MKNYTDVTFILDRSGSMSSVVKDTKGGFDNFIEEQKKSGNAIKFTLFQFDTEFETVYNGVDIQNVGPLQFMPRGGTALLDAIGRSINAAGERFKKMPESERPAKVLFVITTDGEENASREFTSEKIREMIQHQESQYQWQFVFMGANQDAFSTAQNYGIMKSAAINYNATPEGTADAYMFLSGSVRSYCSNDNKVETNFFNGQDNASEVKV